jgi:hypothetical protein
VNSGNFLSYQVSVVDPLAEVTVNNLYWSWDAYPGGFTQSSPNATVTAVGGMGPYTYTWERVSGDATTVIQNPTPNTARWARVNMALNKNYSSGWRCLVTDSTGHTAYSPTITVRLKRWSSMP